MKNRNVINNNSGANSDIVANVILENGDDDSEDIYSKVFENPEAKDISSFQSNKNISSHIPKPAVRRKKRKDQAENYTSGDCAPHPPSLTKHVTFDWLSGAHKGGEGGAGEKSQLAVLKNMVYKLSVELGKEQSKRRDTGLQLDEAGDAPWLAQVGIIILFPV